MQPKSVLYDYLTDLIGGADNGELSVNQSIENCDAAKSAIATSTPGIQPEVHQLVAEREGDDAVSLAGEPTADLTGVEQCKLADTASREIPRWALQPFQILMIRLHGINLAVPLLELDSILRWNGEVTAIPGQPRWQRGLLLHKQSKIRLVDPSSLIMPERQVTGASPGYLLLVGDARWGLICNSIQRPRLLRADEVRWSKNRQYRPWSYGIIVENLSVLLNVDALLAMLGTNDA